MPDNSDKWIEAAKKDDIPDQGTLRVECGREAICLYNLGGEIFATQDECSHGSASLSEGFIVEECLIECPLHQGSFNIKNGQAVSVPCKDDIRIYPVKIESDKVYVQIAA